MGQVITPQHLRMLASTLGSVLDHEHVFFMVDVRTYAGARFPLDDEGFDFIGISRRLTHEGTLAHVLSYIRPGPDIPIEVHIHSDSDYSRIFVKVHDSLTGYEPLARDGSYNLIQEKILRPAAVDVVRDELARLSRLS